MNNLRPIRIWMFALEYPPMLQRGGLGTHLRELVEGMAAPDTKIDIFVPHTLNERSTDNPETIECITLPDATLHFCPMPGFPPLQENMLWRARNDTVFDAGLKYIAQNTPPDVIHCHDWYLFDAASRLRAHCSASIISTAHLSQAVYARWGGSPSMTAVREERRMCSESDCVLTVSNSMKDVIRSFYDMPAARIEVVYNGMSGTPRQVEKTSPAKSEKDPKTVLYAGRVIPQKGIIELIKSAEIVLASRKNVAYLIVGCKGGAYERQLRDYCGKSSLLRDHILFKPLMKHAELQEMYQTADLAVVPSCYEPFGYAALEAMLSGTCVIASDSGGLTEVIEDKVTGFLAPMEYDQDGVCRCSPQALAKLQLILLANEALRHATGQHARTTAAARFTREKMCRETLHQYLKSRKEGVGST